MIEQVINSALNLRKVPLIQTEDKVIVYYNGAEKSTKKKKIEKTLLLKNPSLKLKHIKVIALPEFDLKKLGWKKLKHFIKLSEEQDFVFIPAYIDIKAKKNKDDMIRFGRMIRYADLELFEGFSKKYRYIRARLFALGTSLDVDTYFTETKASPIVHPKSTSAIEKEIVALRATNKYLEQSGFELFITKEKKSPNIVHEIGRCREIVFRAVGEGTLNEIDLDDFDLHYLHLFLWDKINKQIAGAYRLGDGKYIMEHYGPKGFYIRSLFQIKKEMFPMLTHCLELGRSFVSAEYQQKRLPLFLLWKGIHQFAKNNKHIDYIIGPVTISNKYSKVSQSIIVKFVKKYHFDKKLATLVKPKNAFKPDFKKLDTEVLFKAQDGSAIKLDYLLEDIDLHRLKMPVLYKKYFQQNAKIIGFNRDPLFNDALDGFMVVKADELLFHQSDD
jgi:hypothetical protein